MMDNSTPPTGAAALDASVTASLGARLRAGREVLQLTVAEVATKLRVSHAIVEAVERDDLARLGAPVYARGYLHSYASLIGLPIAVVDSALQRVVEPLPLLHSAAHTSHGRLLMDRYARRAASIVLTASIVVPVVWLANEERLPVQPVALRSLDLQAPVKAESQVTDDHPPLASGEVMGPPEMLAGLPAQAAREAQDVPIMASFAPFLNSRSVAPAEQPNVDTAGWTLVFRGDSWVEIIDHAGKRLEFGVIRGGNERHYPADSIARVSLGNASVVDVVQDGKSLSLAPFQKANVARFTVSSAGELTPAGG